MERKRSGMYYLDKAFRGHYALGADGAVSDIYDVEVRETKRIPSRVAGLDREVENGGVYVPQHGHEYSDLRELALRVDNPLTAPLHDEKEARMMVDSVYDRLVRGLAERRSGRPIYEDIEEGK